MVNTSASDGYLAPTPAQFVEDTALDALLQGLVVGITGLPGPKVTVRWQPEGTVEYPFGTNWCSVGVTTEIEDQYGNQTDTDAGYSLLHFDTLEVIASFYGPAARSNAKLFKMGLLINQNIETLQRAGLAMMSVRDDLVIAPALQNERWVYRVDTHFSVRRASVVNYNVLDVESVAIGITAEEGVETFTETILVQE